MYDVKKKAKAAFASKKQKDRRGRKAAAGGADSDGEAAEAAAASNKTKTKTSRKDSNKSKKEAKNGKTSNPFAAANVFEVQADEEQQQQEQEERNDYDVYLGGFPSEMSDEDLKSYLQETADCSVDVIFVKRFPKARKRRSIAFVKLADDEDDEARAEAVDRLLGLKGKELLGSALTVSEFLQQGKPRNTKKQSKGVCFDFQNKGKCARGDDCPFDHVEATAEEIEQRKAEQNAKKAKHTPREEKPQTTVFVANLPFGSSEDEIREKFSACGDIEGVRLVKSKETGKFTGAAFVQFVEESGMSSAVEMSGEEWKGREFTVKIAESKRRERPPRKTEDGADKSHPTNSRKRSREESSGPRSGAKPNIKSHKRKKSDGSGEDAQAESDAVEPQQQQQQKPQRQGKRQQGGQKKDQGTKKAGKGQPQEKTTDAFVYGNIVGFKGKKMTFDD